MAKKPKKIKQPKISAGIGAWENYETRVKERDKKIAKAEADVKRKKSIIARAKKRTQK